MNKTNNFSITIRLIIMSVICSYSITLKAQSLSVTPSESKGVMVDGVFNVLENSRMTFKSTFDNPKDSVTKVKNSSYEFAGSKGTISTSVLGGKLTLYDVSQNSGASSNTTKQFKSVIEYYTGDSVMVQVNDTTWDKRWEPENKLHSVSSNVIDVLVWKTPETKLNGETSVRKDGIAEGLSWDVTNQGGYDKGWVVKWTYDGKTYDGNKFNMPTYINTTGQRQYLDIVMEAVNYAPDGQTEWGRVKKTITVNVSSAPTVIVDIPTLNGYSAQSVTASATTYATPNDSKWTFEWTLDGNSTVTTTEPNYTFVMPTVQDGDSWSGNLKLVSKNSKSSLVINENVNIAVNSYSTGSSSAVTPDSVNANSTSSITLKTKPFGGMPSGWTYEWKDNGRTIATGTSQNYTFSPINASGKEESHVYSVVAKNAINGIVGYEKELFFENITLWPTCIVPKAIRMVDQNNLNNDTYCIREGNEYSIDMNGYKGGYAIDGEEQWAENWYRGNDYLDSSSPTLTAVINSSGYKQSIQTVDVSVVLTNMGPYDNYWFNKRINQEIIIYKRPETPTGLMIKGSASRILVATLPITDNQLADCEYYLVFGSTGNSEHVVNQYDRAEKYYQFSSSEFNVNNEYYVYSMWRYKDGAVVTSGKRYLNRTDELWDGSDFSKTLDTRGVVNETETTSITEVEKSDSVSSEIYDIRGNKVIAMQKGLYIVKYSDGTVRKVYNNK